MTDRPPETPPAGSGPCPIVAVCVVALVAASGTTWAFEAESHAGPEVVLWGDALDVDGGTAEGTIEIPDRADAAAEENEWFVAPVPFYSPQLDWGLAVIGGYIFDLDRDDPETPPSTAAVGAFYTDNESYGASAATRVYLPGGRWRLAGGAGGARVRYDFYGIGEGAGDDGLSLPFQTEFAGAVAEGLRRIAPDLYLGPRVTYARATTEIRVDLPLPPELRPDAFDTTIATLGAHLELDTRDDVYYPSTGSRVGVLAGFHETSWGDSFDYQVYEIEARNFRVAGEPGVLAWRFVGRFTAGDVPFYDLGQYDLRGYERGRYRDRMLVAGEVEYRRMVTTRMGFVAFTSVGRVVEELSDLNSGSWLPAAGVGFRLRLTKSNNLNYRIDVARGKNATQFYFSITEAF